MLLLTSSGFPMLLKFLLLFHRSLTNNSLLLNLYEQICVSPGTSYQPISGQPNCKVRQRGTVPALHEAFLRANQAELIPSPAPRSKTRLHGDTCLILLRVFGEICHYANSCSPFKTGKVAWWAKALQLERKVPSSNLTRRSARLKDPTSLRSSRWPSSRNYRNEIMTQIDRAAGI